MEAASLENLADQITCEVLLLSRFFFLAPPHFPRIFSSLFLLKTKRITYNEQSVLHEKVKISRFIYLCHVEMASRLCHTSDRIMRASAKLYLQIRENFLQIYEDCDVKHCLFYVAPNSAPAHTRPLFISKNFPTVNIIQSCFALKLFHYTPHNFFTVLTNPPNAFPFSITTPK